MRAYYQILEAIKNYLDANININTTRIGNISEVDLKKQNIYPLAHIVAGEVDFREQVLAFNMQVIVMDSVVETLNEKDEFGKIDNKIDVANTMLTVINGLQLQLNKGALYNANFHLDGQPIATPFEDEYSNLLTGWSLDFTVIIPNNEIGICDYQLDWDISGSIPTEKYMEKIIYDTNNNGVVDNTEKLGGNPASYYAAASHIHNAIDVVFSPTGSLTAIEVQTAIEQAAAQGFSQQEVLDFINGIGVVSGSSQISYTGITDVPVGIISGSEQVSYTSITDVPVGIVSGSSQIVISSTTGQLDVSRIDNLPTTSLPSGTVSGSSQIDHNQTTNFVVNEHLDWSVSQSIDIHPDNYLTGSDSSVLPSGSVSSSIQIDHDLTTNYTSSEHFEQSQILITESQITDLTHTVIPDGTISGSSQVNYTELQNISTGLVSGSSQVVLQDTTGQLLSSRIDGLTSGSVTDVKATLPISSSGGSTPNISLVDSTVTPGAYNFANVTVDSKGIITDIETGQNPSGSLDLTNVAYTNVTNVFTKFQTVANELYISGSEFGSSSIEVISSGSTVFEVDTFGNVSGKSYVKNGSTNDDILLGDGSTTALSGLQTSLPAGVVSGSSQVDHDLTTNYTSSEHIDWTTDQGGTLIDPGNYLLGGVDPENTAYTNVNNQFIIDQTITGSLLITSSIDPSSYIKFYNGNNIVFEVTQSGDVYAQTYYGDGSKLTGIITSSYQDSDVRNVLNTDNVLSGSQQIVDSLPSGSVSSSIQVDHNTTTNYSASRHFLQSEINITESQISDLVHYTDIDVKDKLNIENVVSSSIQVDHNTTSNFSSSRHFLQTEIAISQSQIVDLDHYTDSDTLTYIDGLGIVSSSNQISYNGITDKPTIVSSSIQVDHDQTTNYTSSEHFTQAQISITESQVSDLQHYTDSDVKNKLNIENVLSGSIEQNLPTGIVSGSSQISYNGITDIPLGIISSSSQLDGTTIIALTGSFNGSFDGIHWGQFGGEFSGSANGDFTGDGSGLTNLTESQITDLQHYTDTDNKLFLDTIDVVSGSVITQLPSGIVSGSIQIDHNQTTNFTTDKHFLQSQILIASSQIANFNTSIRLVNDEDGVISGSSQINASEVTTGTFPSSVMPPIAITDTFVAINEVEMLSFQNIQKGDIVVRTDQNRSYINLNSINNTMGDWQELLTPTDSVLSVNGYTGTVILITSDITEGANLYFTNTRVSNSPAVILNTAKVGYTDSLVKSKMNADNVVSGSYVSELPSGIVSGSIQIDHNQTTNYDVNRHFLQSEISITESQVSDLVHYTDQDNLDYMNSIEVVSGSVLTQLPAGTVSGSSQINYPEISNIPTGIVSGSSQIDISNTTGVLDASRLVGSITASAIDYVDIFNKPSLVSGSSQISYNGITDIPSGIISSSVQVSYNGITDKPTLVSSSVQIDHNQTTNYDVNQHFSQSQISITESQISDLVHYTTNELPSGTISGSSQVDFNGISNKPAIVSSSLQIDHNNTTNYDINRHFLQSEINITETQISDLTHYTDIDNQSYLDSIGIVTGSIDVDNVAYKNINNNFVSRQTITDNTGTVLSVVGTQSGDLLRVIDDNTGDRLVITDVVNGELLKIDNSGDLLSSGSVSASTYYGDGSNLTGINVPTSSIFPFIKFETTGSNVWEEGKIEYDNVNKALVVYNDEADIKLQVGQEMHMRVFNNTTSSIADGKIVSIDSVTVDGIPTVVLSDASLETLAKGIVGVSTHIIEAQTFGYITTSGFVNNIDTSPYSPGTVLYMSDIIPGDFTDISPTSPNYEVKIGSVSKIGGLDGKFYVNISFNGNFKDIFKFYNGSILETHSIVVTTDGTTVSLQLNNDISGSKLSLIFDTLFVQINDGTTVNLTTGTDSNPLVNYVYIPKSNKVLTVSTSGFPTNEQYIAIANLLVPTATLVQSDGLYKEHAWTDTLSNPYGKGHLVDINKWIRNQHATWLSGNVFSFDTGFDTQVANLNIAYTIGKILQLHEHNTPAWDTSGADNIYVVNDSLVPYKKLSSLNSVDITDDSLGNNVGGRFWVGVIWATVSEETGHSQLFLNLPNDSYGNVTNSLTDSKNSANFNIPYIFKGTGYLLSKIVFKNTGNNIEIPTGGITDLRGIIPSSGGNGTVGGIGITTLTGLSDTPSTYIDSANKPIVGNLGETGVIFNTIGIAPVTSSSTGSPGEVIYTTDYVYVCTATNIWKRSPLTTW